MGLVSHPFKSNNPRAVIYMHRARLLRPLTATLCVSVLLLASHTPRSTDSPASHATLPKPSTARMVDGRVCQSAFCCGMMS